jgi:hypothetical protein
VSLPTICLKQHLEVVPNVTKSPPVELETLHAKIG